MSQSEQRRLPPRCPRAPLRSRPHRSARGTERRCRCGGDTRAGVWRGTPRPSGHGPGERTCRGRTENPKQLYKWKPAGRRHLALRQSAARLRPASPLIGGWSRRGRGVARAGGVCAFSSCRVPMAPAGDSAFKVEVRPFRWASLYSQVATDKQ